MSQKHIFRKYLKYRSKYLNLKAGQDQNTNILKGLMDEIKEKNRFHDKFNCLASYLRPIFKTGSDVMPDNLENQIYSQVYVDYNFYSSSIPKTNELMDKLRGEVESCYRHLNTEGANSQKLGNELHRVYLEITNNRSSTTKRTSQKEGGTGSDSESEFNSVFLCFLGLFWFFYFFNKAFSGVEMVEYRESDTTHPEILSLLQRSNESWQRYQDNRPQRR